ncbi:MAG: divalent cation transporter [Rhizobiales bacterium 24-66-13]|jgi:cobalt-zinc-cadmium efflux system outer membrane protein|uniref:TolC family protein n=1 Tax=Roseixanthobacter finlandensis TaxID=3119922 RepID=UPI000BDDBBC6|nr:MAG: divalent cation transporter [Rhizobiales bacterium 35-66-30]OYZ82499.1 MAG: divalent cation transporter [Rhizobiales bacterium 24-66-13]OZB11267.1 MAG: divalent cation transporter [Rhizobiales bacterium 39-66-18]HQS46496.1 TolC family protein [Xanthobacteraceae bacterium]
MSFHALALALGAALALLHAPQTLAASPRPITLSQALASALAANPRLTATERDIGIAGGRSIQAAALPNPNLSLEVENAFGTNSYQGLDLAETTLQVSQLVELGGKREARIAAANAGVGAARWESEALRLQVLAETTAVFVAVLSAQRRLDVLQTQVGAIERLAPLLQNRVQAGASSPAEISRARVAADLAKVEMDRAKAALSTSRRELALLMGLSEAKFGPVKGNLAKVNAPPPLQRILKASQENPQLTRFTALKAQRSAELSGARAKAIPDVTLGVGYRHYNETVDSGMVFSLSVPLPLFDQNQGGIIEANESLRKAEAEEAVVRSALISQIGRAHDTLKASYDEIAILRSGTIPEARTAFQGIESGYSEGRYTLLELLDAQSALTETTLRELDALVSYHTALAALEGLTGRPVTFAKGKSK